MIVFNNVAKTYPNGVQALKDVNLTVNDGEFVAIIGLSGAGKSTLLRSINKMHEITAGSIYIDHIDVSKLRGKELRMLRRNIGMIFQSFNLVKRMSVFNNVLTGRVAYHSTFKTLFGLFPREDKLIALEALETMGILEKAFTRADQLSGGQQQRVALARALVIQPDVLLMDEPLSNLDAKLRVEMRTVIKEIQNKLNITTVYVTHDQEEAMAVSDRIAVMEKGVIQQLGSPKDLYQRPANKFVAGFIGKTNIITRALVPQENTSKLQISDSYAIDMPGIHHPKTKQVLVSIRPEDFQIVEDTQGMTATVDDSIFLGLMTNYFVTLETGERADIIQESTINSIYIKGSAIRLQVNAEKINVFSEDGAKNLLLEE